MKTFFFFFLFFGAALVSIRSLPVICVDSNLGITLGLDCDDLKIYKLKDDLCSHNGEQIEIDAETNVFSLSHHIANIPIKALSKYQISQISNLEEIISDLCPQINSPSFLKLGESSSSYLDIIDTVTVTLWNADGMSGNRGLYANYYQYSPQVHTFTFLEDPKLNFKSLNQYFGFFNDNATYYVDSAKIYSQACGEMEEDVFQIDNFLARENPFRHTIDLLIFLLYDVFNPTTTKVHEFHEVLEFCLKNDLDNRTHQLIMDRTAGSDGDQKLRFFNSKINFYYNGEGDGCALNSTKWADHKAGICNGTQCLVPRTARINMEYPIDKVVKIGTDFLLGFKKFSSMFNCQHFATNAWNLIANDTLDFENYNIMLVHSKHSGLEPHTPFIDKP